MQLSPLPDVGSNRRLALAALVVTVVVGAALIWHDGDLARTLGDTDDAMRLVLVRDLLAGRGWYDQWVGRLQPPIGTYMHWSRLVDGGLAAMTWLFRLALSPSAAEAATRMVWPLMWIYPAVVCALVIARRLGGSAAVIVCAVLLVTNLQVYEQFRPGRVDHHNVQIVMTLIAAACAMAAARRERWAWLAGAAAGLGLAVGLEALAFQALIGASYGLRLAFDRNAARPARNYALALSAATLVLYALQTPAWRWPMSFCDALGLNLVAAVVLAGAGLAAVATWGRGLSTSWRVGVLALVGAVAGGVYLAADPLCLHGPLAAVDPRMGPFWFDKVQELQSWPRLLRDNVDRAIATMTAAIMVLAAAAFLLVRDGRRPQPQTLLACAGAALAAAAASQAYRMQDYVFWLGFPVLAAAFSLAAARILGGRLLPTPAASVLLSPLGVGLCLTRLVHLAPAIHRPTPAAQGPVVQSPFAMDEHCFDAAVYRPLAALPPGLVIAEIDLGPFILAHTADSVLAAPYHRMSWGILAAHDALGAPSAAAELKFRALKADYLVECPTNALRVGPDSVEADVRRGRAPVWLQPLSPRGQTLQIYRIRPAPVAGHAKP
jgi:hypothetical protein